jgi:hypothetical protein
MIVIIGGMFRSGSTFSFNIARELLEAKALTATSLRAPHESTADIPEDCRHLVVKTHAPDEPSRKLIELGAIKCICTFRSPEEAITSWMHTFGFSLDESIKSFREWVNWHQQLSSLTLNISHDQIEKHPLLCILRIQHFLFGRIHLAEALRLKRKYNKQTIKNKYRSLPEDDDTQNIGFSHYDKKTYFHRRHISENKVDCTDENREIIRSAFSDSIDIEGRYRPNPEKR